MRLVLAILAVSVLLVGLCTAGSSDWTYEDGVLVLDDSNFDRAVQEFPVIAIELYAPWCGHCKALAKPWSEAAQRLENEGVGIKLAKVDATVNTQAASMFDVRGYPTIKVLHAGRPSSYEGPRDADGIYRTMKAQTLPAVSRMSHAAYQEWAAAQADNSFHVALFVTSTDSGSVVLDETVEAVGNSFRGDASVVLVAGAPENRATIVRRFPDEEPTVDIPSIVVDSSSIKAAEEKSTEDIASFIRSNSIPLVAELNGATVKQLVGLGKPLVVLFLDLAQTDSNQQLLTSVIRPAAHKYAGKFVFAYLDNAKFGSHKKRLGFADDRVPALAVDGLKPGWFAPLLDDAITLDNIDRTIETYKEGRSEAVPAAQNEPVFKLVGKSFDQVVNDPEKDVLVFFGSPNCGHCKAAKPTYEKLAHKFASVPSVRIAYLDATANTFPETISIRGYPTFFFFPSGTSSKKGMLVEADRTVDAWTDFILSHAGTPIDSSKLADIKDDDEAKDEL